ncbi:Homeodomain-like protein [Paraphysoderma sedebokerense]|nr:Homeodomain-like protein [Paraphysoderma sedebokerense]
MSRIIPKQPKLPFFCSGLLPSLCYLKPSLSIRSLARFESTVSSSRPTNSSLSPPQPKSKSNTNSLPSRDYRKWSPEEDKKLLDLYSKHGPKWSFIAPSLPGRSAINIYLRYHNRLKPEIQKTGPWTTAEENILKQYAVEYQEDWTQIGNLMQRTPHSCRYRYVKINKENSFKKEPWTPNEDVSLMQAVSKWGNQWSKIAEEVGGRTDVQCRFRYTQQLLLEKKMGPWTPDEDYRLTQAVNEHGKDWIKVATLVPGRTNLQCRQRYKYVLDPSIDKSPFTTSEQIKLLKLYLEKGRKWAKIASNLAGRTDKQCLEIFDSLISDGQRHHIARLEKTDVYYNPNRRRIQDKLSSSAMKESENVEQNVSVENAEEEEELRRLVKIAKEREEKARGRMLLSNGE